QLRRLHLDPAEHRLDPGLELGNGEGLRQVVVGPEFQPQDAVELGGPGREHQHRHGDPLEAKVADDVEPVAAGEHDVEDDQVVAARGRGAVPGRPVVDDVHGVPEVAQVQGDQVRDVVLVLDHENATFHGAQHSNNRSPRKGLRAVWKGRGSIRYQIVIWATSPG